NKWLNLRRYKTMQVNNTEACFNQLRSEGYRILVADPSADGISINDVDVTKWQLSLVFGHELHGASEYRLAHGDQKVRIPMFGFTESFNISVSVAICLSTILEKLRASGMFIGLSDEEKQSIRLAWYRKIVRRSDILER